MDGQLSLGTVIILVTVFIHAISFSGIIRLLGRIAPKLIEYKHIFAGTLIVIATVLAIFLVHTVEIWIWAGTYYFLGEINHFKDALYFSTATFTTLGYGDITLSPDWQLLSALEAVNGILLFGWSTAFLFAVLTRIWRAKGLPPLEAPKD